jgi:hypothetical protein
MTCARKDFTMRYALLALNFGNALSLAQAAVAQHSTMPAGVSHEDHLKQLEKDAAMKKRGADAMGFDQDAATHHFLLSPEGGTIEVGVQRGSDRKRLDAIRAHLKEIAVEFAQGVFEKPFATHAELPPGTSAMQRLRTSITYRYEETRQGGRVRIAASTAEGRAAVHEFLRYQIAEHHTGDPLTVKQ